MFHFVPNLKPYTFHRGRGNRRFDAYLVSADYLDEQDTLARAVVREGRVLCADNGNVDLIRDSLKTFESVADELDSQRKVQEAGLGRYARPGDLTGELTAEYQRLAREIRGTSRDATPRSYVRDAIRRQASSRPGYLIGMEDVTVATMTGLGLEPEYTLLPESFYRSVFERAVELAVDTQRGRYEPVDAQVFACLHALDYDTARLAGKVAGEAGVAGIATGLFGVMKDRNYVDYRVADGELLPLPRAVPRPYPRVVEIAAGLHLGYAEAQGRRPPFHALGVGSPILLPLLALFGDAETYTSTDSTAPIVDGWIAPTISLYVDEPAPFKYKAHRIAEYWLAEGDGWRCECPYCRGFNRSHPPSVDEARRWWKSEGQPRLDSGSMQRTSPLSPLLPMLSNPPDPNVRRQAGMARVGHNHWVLKRIEQGLRDHSGTSRELRGWVERQVAAYVAASASPSWRGALEAAWKIGAAAHDTLNS